MKKVETNPIHKYSNLLYDLLPSVMEDRSQTDNEAEILCWAASECLTRIKENSLEEYNDIKAHFLKDIVDIMIKLEREEEYEKVENVNRKVENLNRFKALLIKEMKW